jgi:hypothetical protein
VSIPKRKPLPTNDAPVTEPTATTIADDQSHEQLRNIASDPEKDVATGTWEPRAVNNGAPRRFVFPALSLAVFDKVRLGPLDKYLPYEQRKRRYTIAGIFAGLIIALLALIIGLAVGLTAGKK